MTGNNEYIKRNQDKVSRFINKHNEKNFLQGYVNYITNGRVNSASSRYNYVCIVNKFIDKTNKNINDLEYDDYNNYIISSSKDYSTYRVTVYSALKYFAEYLEISKHINNPIKSMKKPKQRDSQETKNKRDNGYLTKEEIGILRNNIRNGVGSKRAKSRQKSWRERDEAIIMMMLCTGLRRKGICGLDIDDVNLEEQTIKTTEKGGTIRYMAIPYDLIVVLNSWLDLRKEKVKDKNEIAFFITNRGKRITVDTIDGIINKYADGIDGKHITPHKLRHTFAYHYLEQCNSLNKLQVALGHKNIATTELYRHQEKDFKQEDADEIGRRMFL